MLQNVVKIPISVKLNFLKERRMLINDKFPKHASFRPLFFCLKRINWRNQLWTITVINNANRLGPSNLLSTIFLYYICRICHTSFFCVDKNNVTQLNYNGMIQSGRYPCIRVSDFVFKIVIHTQLVTSFYQILVWLETQFNNNN